MPLSFRYIPPIGKESRMKTPLKNGIRIRFACCSNCTLVVTPCGIFSVSLTFFFSLRLLVRVCTERDTIRNLPWRDCDELSLATDVVRLFCRSPPLLRQQLHRGSRARP